LIALPVIFAVFVTLMMFGRLAVGHLIAQRAASAGARAAVVILYRQDGDLPARIVVVDRPEYLSLISHHIATRHPRRHCPARHDGHPAPRAPTPPSRR
jgi:hypothetical protein